MNSSTEFQLRSACEKDLAFLLKLRKETMEEHLQSMDLPIDEHSHLERILYKFESAKIVYLEEKAVGLLKYGFSDDFFEIIQIQLSPETQGMGYGSKLVYLVLDEAEKAGKPVRLSVLKSNPARHLYSRLGFCLIYENDIEYTMQKVPNKNSQHDAAKNAAPLL